MYDEIRTAGNRGTGQYGNGIEQPDIDPSSVRTVYLKGVFPLLRQRIDRRHPPCMKKDLLKGQLDILEEPGDGLTADIRNAPEAIVKIIMAALEKNGDGSCSRKSD